ncbi:cysteine desulfurase family protein [Pseudokineococcus basanitobsidens]|uniref:Cysteine desulfurase family protein n=1 Tax=Pseudokineococcus basanitobsidens TaxID=1926649 RepID=A0ABU8RKF2_9ACTN
MIYLDHAATAPPSRAVLEAQWPYLTQVFANPSSTHEPGRAARAGLDAALAEIAAVLGCRPGEVVLTSGGTEADDLALLGLAAAAPRGRHVVTTAVEHPAVLETARALGRGVQGAPFRVDEVGVDGNGVVDLAAVAAVLTPETTICSVMLANNEVGTVQPVREVAALCRAVGVPLHVDAVQAPGQLDVRLDALGADLLSVSAHKLGGPRGAGVLAVRGSVPLAPHVHGGGQQRGRRSGTVDVAAAVGTARALRLAEEGRAAGAPRLAGLRDRLVAGVLAAVPGAVLTGPPVDAVLADSTPGRLPGHASFVFPGLGGETVLLELEERGVVCSSGSACAAGSEDASHVLLAMGLGDDAARTAVRLTLGPATTEDDVDAVVRLLPDAVAAAGGPALLAS